MVGSVGGRMVGFLGWLMMHWVDVSQIHTVDAPHLAYIPYIFTIVRSCPGVGRRCCDNMSPTVRTQCNVNNSRYKIWVNAQFYCYFHR
ncbi:hypothetical protein F4774DRAFT_220349 [Daldinia eschscholtzii]|nr:hypothetical protein F4774DRAFT_220349 [Daldinia eschscholtzii]